MKRITGPILFLTTFALGIAILSLRYPPTHAIVQPSIVPVAAPVTPTLSPAVDDDDFRPEFRDLPDLGDDAYETTTTKLVDVFEYGNEYFRSEAVAKTGEVWLGLFETKGKKYQLKNAKVAVSLTSKAKDPDYEDSVRLGFGTMGEALFLLKNSKTLKPGQVYTIYHRPSQDEVASRNLPLKELSVGYVEEFRQLGEIYKLRVAPGTTVDGTKVNVLVLETKNSQQILTSNLYYKDHNTLYNSIGNLLWVGDLDGDNKLDLYLSDFGFEKGGFGSQIFLSSEAEPGKLVKRVGQFSTSGC